MTTPHILRRTSLHHKTKLKKRQPSLKALTKSSKFLYINLPKTSTFIIRMTIHHQTEKKETQSKEMSSNINQDQDIMALQSNPIFDQDPTCQESYDDPLKFWYSISDDPLSSQEQSPIQHPPPKKEYDIPSISSTHLIQNQ